MMKILKYEERNIFIDYWAKDTTEKLLLLAKQMWKQDNLFAKSIWQIQKILTPSVHWRKWTLNNSLEQGKIGTAFQKDNLLLIFNT